MNLITVLFALAAIGMMVSMVAGFREDVRRSPVGATPVDIEFRVEEKGSHLRRETPSSEIFSAQYYLDGSASGVMSGQSVRFYVPKWLYDETSDDSVVDITIYMNQYGYCFSDTGSRIYPIQKSN